MSLELGNAGRGTTFLGKQWIGSIVDLRVWDAFWVMKSYSHSECSEIWVGDNRFEHDQHI